MTWWTVSTEDKKSVFEHELWQKDDCVIRHITGYRWGTYLIETDDDNPPVLNQTDGPGADGVDMNNTEYNYELDNLSDGWYEDFIWPDDMDEEERDRLLAIWEEDGYGGWEEEGWEQYDTEVWFHGPLLIEKHQAWCLSEKHQEQEWQEPAEDEWERAEITPELQDHFQRALGNLDEEITFDELAKINPADENKSNTPKAAWPFPNSPTEKE